MNEKPDSDSDKNRSKAEEEEDGTLLIEEPDLSRKHNDFFLHLSQS